MVMKHRRLGILARWLHRCPKCGAWFALRRTQKDSENILGIISQYRCDQCSEIQKDWDPSDQVKF